MALILFYIYLAILILTVALGGYNYKYFSTNIKIIFFLVLAAMVTESVGVALAEIYQTKNYVYHIYSIVELSLTCIFLIKVINIKRVVYYYILFLSSVFLELILIRYQPIKEFNTNMLILESLFITSLALYVLYRLFMDEKINNIYMHAHFWICVVLLLYWSGSFFYWALVDLLVIKKNVLGKILVYWQIVINIIFYCSLTIIFYLYPKHLKNVTEA